LQVYNKIFLKLIEKIRGLAPVGDQVFFIRR